MRLSSVCGILCFYSLPYASFSSEPLPNTASQDPPGRSEEAGACYSLESAMAIFNKAEYRSLLQVRELLEAYKYNCYLRDINVVEKRFPFVVIEAPRRRKRFLLAKRLGKILGAAVMFSPPMGWAKFRNEFNISVELRRAFHSLSIYGSANNALQHLGRRPVVMSGFWLDQATFSIAKKYYPDFPTKESTVYHWPKDLLKPDFVFFVNEPLPNAFANNKNESIRYQILQVYRQWSDPKISELYMDEEISIQSIVEEMIIQLRDHIPSAPPAPQQEHVPT